MTLPLTKKNIGGGYDAQTDGSLRPPAGRACSAHGRGESTASVEGAYIDGQPAPIHVADQGCLRSVEGAGGRGTRWSYVTSQGHWGRDSDFVGNARVVLIVLAIVAAAVTPLDPSTNWGGGRYRLKGATRARPCPREKARTAEHVAFSEALWSGLSLTAFFIHRPDLAALFTHSSAHGHRQIGTSLSQWDHSPGSDAATQYYPWRFTSSAKRSLRSVAYRRGIPVLRGLPSRPTLSGWAYLLARYAAPAFGLLPLRCLQSKALCSCTYFAVWNVHLRAGTRCWE